MEQYKLSFISKIAYVVFFVISMLLFGDTDNKAINISFWGIAALITFLVLVFLSYK
jgi:hypothetical protein